MSLEPETANQYEVRSMSKEPKPVEREYLGVDEAETLSGRSRWTWRRDCYAGRVASCKVGRRLLIPIDEVRRVMSEGYRPRLVEGRQ
jgi:hypothetical protein